MRSYGIGIGIGIDAQVQKELEEGEAPHQNPSQSALTEVHTNLTSMLTPTHTTKEGSTQSASRICIYWHHSDHYL